MLPITAITGAWVRSSIEHAGAADVAGVEDHVAALQVRGERVGQLPPEAGDVRVGDGEDRVMGA